MQKFLNTMNNIGRMKGITLVHRILHRSILGEIQVQGDNYRPKFTLEDHEIFYVGHLGYEQTYDFKKTYPVDLLFFHSESSISVSQHIEAYLEAAYPTNMITAARSAILKPDIVWRGNQILFFPSSKVEEKGKFGGLQLLSRVKNSLIKRSFLPELVWKIEKSGLFQSTLFFHLDFLTLSNIVLRVLSLFNNFLVILIYSS